MRKEARSLPTIDPSLSLHVFPPGGIESHLKLCRNQERLPVCRAQGGARLPRSLCSRPGPGHLLGLPIRGRESRLRERGWSAFLWLTRTAGLPMSPSPPLVPRDRKQGPRLESLAAKWLCSSAWLTLRMQNPFGRLAVSAFPVILLVGRF